MSRRITTLRAETALSWWHEFIIGLVALVIGCCGCVLGLLEPRIREGFDFFVFEPTIIGLASSITNCKKKNI